MVASECLFCFGVLNDVTFKNFTIAQLVERPYFTLYEA